MMDKLKFAVIGFLLSAPIFFFTGYQSGEEEAALMFLGMQQDKYAIETKTFTKMSVLLHDQEIERLAKLVSYLAHASHDMMMLSSKEFELELDEDAHEYFIRNKHRLMKISP